MRILIEGYQYRLGETPERSDLRTVLRELGGLEDVEGNVAINYVGYYYSAGLKDCVFILPKVLISDEAGEELVFGKYRAEDIINVDTKKTMSDTERQFIREFAVWIYRAIKVYHNENKESKIIYYKQLPQLGHGRRKMSNTFLDVILSLIRFNRDNQNFFFFTLRNQHSGLNKINWIKTIAKGKALMQDLATGQSVAYLDVINRKRRINFDEELLVIFFSILQYVNRQYGFSSEININYPLIPKAQFETYRKGLGKRRLLQIKHKYFSDKALELWELCYAFFEHDHMIRSSADMQEYLLAKDFNIVFEDIVDKLIGDKLPKKYEGMKRQEDGKLVDHMYSWYSLTTRDKDEQKKIFYIGDSKYYKRTNNISKESWYKQFTYARNVIQWNLNLFLNGENDAGDVPLRDDTTEGYNVIPNFFISATLDKDLSYQADIYKTDRSKKFEFTRQFENRLFDRDTLLVCHYDVNFLYIISLYARNNRGQQAAWRAKVRDMFRHEIQEMLEEHYDFYVMKPRAGVNATGYITERFQQMLGKVFTPYENDGTERFYSVALSSDLRFEEENSALLAQFETAFHVRQCNIGDDPRDLLADIHDEPTPLPAPSADFLTLHYLEKYGDNRVLVGCYHNDKHLQWILGANDRGTLLYNVRLGKNVHGGQIKAQLNRMTVSFAVLYEQDKGGENRYRVFRVHHQASMNRERLIRTHYPSTPSAEKYLCYVFDEEVSLGRLDIARLLHDRSVNDGSPLFIPARDLINYRR